MLSRYREEESDRSGNTIAEAKQSVVTGHTADVSQIIQPSRENPTTLSPGQVLQLQRTLGNQTVMRLIKQNKAPEQYSRPVQRLVSGQAFTKGTKLLMKN